MRLTKLSAAVAAILGAVIGAVLAIYAFAASGGVVILAALIGAGVAVLDLFLLSKFTQAREARR